MPAEAGEGHTDDAIRSRRKSRPTGGAVSRIVGAGCNAHNVERHSAGIGERHGLCWITGGTDYL